MKNALAILFCMAIAVAVCHAGVIKEGDILDIQVQNNSQFSGRYTVRDNGTTDYPLLSDVSVAGLSTSELMNDLTFRLAKHIDNPLVWITVIDKPEMTLTVLGRINKSGPVTIYVGASIQEVIQAAGGTQAGADIERVKIIRAGGNDENAEYYDFKAFLRKGVYSKLPVLANGDIIILFSEQRTKKVKVIGAVNKPGFFELEEKMNVFEIIYLAGGPAEKADLSRVRRFFKSDTKTLEEVLNIQTYLDKGKLDEIPMVSEGDVIIVYSKWFDWQMALTILTNVLLFVVTIQTLRGALSK